MNSDRDYKIGHDPFDRYENAVVRSRQLTPDEIELWDSCVRSGIFKAGLPFACVMQVISSMRGKGPYTLQQGPKIAPFRSLAQFGVNVLLGSLFYTPICFGKLRERYMENEKKRNDGLLVNALPSRQEGLINVDDTHFGSTLDTNIDNSSYSHLNIDVNSSMTDNLKFEEENVIEKPKFETTYEDLRKQNRENYQRYELPKTLGIDTYRKPPPVSRVDQLEAPPTPPPKPRPRNKYGDEME